MDIILLKFSIIFLFKIEKNNNVKIHTKNKALKILLKFWTKKKFKKN